MFILKPIMTWITVDPCKDLSESNSNLYTLNILNKSHNHTINIWIYKAKQFTSTIYKVVQVSNIDKEIV